MSTYVTDVDATDFATAVVERSREVPVVVDFWAAWCGPCKVLGPTLERLADESGGSWVLAKVDVDRNQQLAGQFGVQGIPTVVAFRDGRPVSRFTGALPEAQVRAFLDELVPSELDLAAEQGSLSLEAGDAAAAEAAFRSVLDRDPAHEAAGLGLADLLLERGDRDEAIEVLGRLPQTEAVKRVSAAARLAPAGDVAALEAEAASGRPEPVLALALALAGRGDHRRALELLVDLVGRREPEISDRARLAALDVFEVLGPDHPVTLEYRRRLASALF